MSQRKLVGAPGAAAGHHPDSWFLRALGAGWTAGRRSEWPDAPARRRRSRARTGSAYRGVIAYAGSATPDKRGFGGATRKDGSPARQRSAANPGTDGRDSQGHRREDQRVADRRPEGQVRGLAKAAHGASPRTGRRWTAASAAVGATKRVNTQLKVTGLRASCSFAVLPAKGQGAFVHLSSLRAAFPPSALRLSSARHPHGNA